MSSSCGSGMSQTGEEFLKKRIRDLESEVASLRSCEVISTRRTRLTSLSGDSCDYVEALYSRITIDELRSKVAESKNVKKSRVQFFRSGGHEALADEDTVDHELRRPEAPGRSLEYCSTGEPLDFRLLAATRVVFTGRVKCKLEHTGSYDAVYQRRSWTDEWVEIFVEIHDLGPGKNDQLRIFIGDVKLVCYGKLKNPHVRQLETFGNKCAGDLKFTRFVNKSAPPMSGLDQMPTGQYEVTSIPMAGGYGFFVATAPAVPLPRRGTVTKLGNLSKGQIVTILEVVKADISVMDNWEKSYAAFMYGRIDFNGQNGWVPLCNIKNDECFVTKSDADKYCKVALQRFYTVERGDAKYGESDTSEIWFAEEQDCNDFSAAMLSWQRNNPQPSLTEANPDSTASDNSE